MPWRLARAIVSSPRSRSLRARAIRAVVAFLADTRGGATALVAAAVTVMVVGGTALVVDHQWLVGQRDLLKAAADSASLAATHRLGQASGQSLSDDALSAELHAVAQRYVLLNLSALDVDRFARARETLELDISIDRDANTVTVRASADLGGTLFSRFLPLLGNYPGPERVTVDSRTECSGGNIEVVLALDVTGSMAAKVDPAGPDVAENRRMAAAIAAAMALVSELHGCEGTDVAVGIVPWDKTVRVPDAERWERAGWADAGALPVDERWAGCVMDRSHSGPLANSQGLSLALPSDPGGAFEAFVYPDTTAFDPGVYDAMRDDALRAFEAHGIGAVLDAPAVRASLVRHSENPWGQTVRADPDLTGGPNFHCTRAPMLALSSDRAAVEARLDALYDPSRRDRGLYGGVTASHLGVTWARRMLAPSWRGVWGSGDHPVDSSEEVTKALVLLTDGLNGASSDRREELPGDVSVAFNPSSGTLSYGCDPCRISSQRCISRERGVSGCGPKTNVYSSRFTALGRFGRGRVEDGFASPGSFAHAATPADARKRLNALLEASCTLAHAEGIDVFTVALFGPRSSVPRAWKDQLIACSGNAQTKTVAERSKFHLRGTDRESLKAVFRDIARRVARVRRT